MTGLLSRFDPVTAIRSVLGFHHTLDHELSVYMDLVPDDPSYTDQEVLADSAFWGKEERGSLVLVRERVLGQKVV